MTASSVKSGSEHALGERDAENSSLLRVETTNNDDLYCMTPPAYIQEVAANEVSVDALPTEDEKVGRPGPPRAYDTEAETPPPVQSREPPMPSREPPTPSQEPPLEPSEPRAAPELRPVTEASSVSDSEEVPKLWTAPEILAGSSAQTTTPSASGLQPVYLSETQMNVALAHTRRCSVLKERPALWLVRRKNIALSPLAATVLMREGLVRQKDLELISQSAGVKREPTDPLSGVMFAAYDTVSDVMLGFIQGPAELGRQIHPLLVKYDTRQQGDALRDVEDSTPEERTRLVRFASEKSAQGAENTAMYSKIGDASNSAKQVAIGTGKGLGRMVGAGLKAPMVFTHGLTRGFHNVPKLYGEEVREYENIVDVRSGLMVSAKSLGHGVSDGLKDFFVKPVEGAQKDGMKGFAKGFGKGLCSLAVKPSAGLCGVAGYSSVGVYKQLQGIRWEKDSASNMFREIGEAEYEQAPDEVCLDVVKRWCQVMMRQR